MRFIQKIVEPSELTAYRTIPTATFDKLDKIENRHIKNKIRKSLLREQGRICCYCGQRISFNSGTTRIEHLLPQSKYPLLQLLYNNLLCSCDGGVIAGTKNPPSNTYCDPHKDNNEIAISPLMVDCEKAFWFDNQGKIWPQPGRIDAKNTIDILNLNAPALIIKREKAIKALRDLSSADWYNEYNSLDVRDAQGLLINFCFVLKSYIENYKLGV